MVALASVALASIWSPPAAPPVLWCFFSIRGRLDGQYAGLR